MIAIKVIAIVATLIKCCEGSNEYEEINQPGSLRSATLRRKNVEESSSTTYATFFDYEPATNVHDHSEIDLDQQEIIKLLNEDSNEAFITAKHIYELGGNARSYAAVTLSEPLPKRIESGSLLHGQTETGENVIGYTLKSANQGAKVIWFLYHFSDTNSARCLVGGKSDPVLQGCLASNGSIKVDSMTSVEYTYDIEKDNRNARRFQQISKESKQMLDCPKCPYEDYQKFFNYYGEVNYADMWMEAAFKSITADFRLSTGDFRTISRIGRGEAVRTITVNMSLYMYILGLMEKALDACKDNCSGQYCDIQSIHSWDQAVAFYTGSLEQKGETGFLLYSFANSACRFFGTCGGSEHNMVSISGDANVNLGIFKQFIEGKDNLMSGKCMEARSSKENISKLMSVPLVQETMRHAHSIYLKNDTRVETVIRGAIYAASVLPIVHHCSADDARTIYNNMRIPQKSENVIDNFIAIKNAFQRNYDCMGITCNDVGGLLDSNGNYQEHAQPCASLTSFSEKTSTGTNSYTSSSSSSGNSMNYNNMDHEEQVIRLERNLTIATVIASLTFIALVISLCCVLLFTHAKRQSIRTSLLDERSSPPDVNVPDKEAFSPNNRTVGASSDSADEDEDGGFETHAATKGHFS